MKIKVTAQFMLRGSKDPLAEIARLQAALLDAESKDPDISESDVAAVVRDGLVSVAVVVKTSSWAFAESRGESIITSAIESIGGRVTEPDAVIQNDLDMRSPSKVVGLLASLQSTELVPA